MLSIGKIRKNYNLLKWPNLVCTDVNHQYMGVAGWKRVSLGEYYILYGSVMEPFLSSKAHNTSETVLVQAD